jgi:hypothetical protein
LTETLLLTHTLGRAGWEVAHAGGASAFALAAVGQCFVRRRLLFNLPLLWRLRTLWRDGMAALDPRALRLALYVDERVRASGASLEVGLSRPAAAGVRAPAPVEIELGLVQLRERDDRLPPPELPREDPLLPLPPIPSDIRHKLGVRIPGRGSTRCQRTPCPCPRPRPQQPLQSRGRHRKQRPCCPRVRD